MELTLVALAVLCFILLVHPYVTYPLSLKLFATRPIAPNPATPLPSATLVFAAYNEARALPEKLANLRAIKALYPNIEIFGYSDCSSDETLALLEGASDILTPVAGTQRAGKATGMGKMVAMARGEIIIFTDANVVLDPASIAPLLGYFRDPQVGGVAGTLIYTNEDASITAQTGGLYWRLEEMIKQREARIGSIMGADGSIFATRRALCPAVPPHLLDDMTTSLSVTFAGYRLLHATDVRAYEKNATSSSDEFRRKRRIACRAFNTHRHLWPRIRASYGAGDLYKYVSHKFLRWLGLVPLVIGGLALAGALALVGLGQLVLLVAALLGLVLVFGRMGVPVLGSLYEILLSITATFFGVVDSLRGRTYQTWAPAQSRN